MTYKNLFISALLLPFAISSNIDVRVQELQNKLAAKEIELSAISKTIAEKEELGHSLLLIGSDIASSILSDLNDQEKAKFKEEFYTFLESVKDALEFKKNIKNVLLEEFIDLSIDATVKLAEFKSLILVSSVEKVVLKKLHKSFAKCLQELSDIGCELGELQKQTLQN